MCLYVFVCLFVCFFMGKTVKWTSFDCKKKALNLPVMIMTIDQRKVFFILTNSFHFQVMNDNGKYTAMPAGFPKFEFDDGEKKFKFRIPRFNQNTLVDPSVTPGKLPSAAHACWLQNNIVFILLFQVAALFVAY